MPQKRIQAKERVYAEFRDQHARPWDCVWDLRGMGTVGTKEPKGWISPIPIPQNIVCEVPGRPLTLHINYEQWIAEWQTALTAYDRTLREWAQRMHSTPTDVEVVRMAGPQPLPVDVIKAMRAGNKWALGLVPINRIPPWAEKYRHLFVNRPEMVAKEEFPDLEEFPDATPKVPAKRSTVTKRAGPPRPRDANGHFVRTPTTAVEAA